MSVTVVVEIGPDIFCAGDLYPAGPFLKFGLAVIMTVPLGLAMKPDIDVVGCLYKDIRQTWPAAGTENNPGGAEKAG